MYSQTSPCLAECGGFMHLHEEMEDRDGIARKMCGVVPGRTWNNGKLCRFGYVTLRPAGEGRMIPPDQSVKAHEFHYWDSTCNGSDWIASRKGTEYQCVVDNGTLLAGYPHFCYYSNPEMAAGFPKRCSWYKESNHTR